MNKNIRKSILAILSISLISSYIIVENGVFALNLVKNMKIEQKDNEFSNVTKEIQDVVDRLKVAGLSISVIENNQISYSQGFGYSNIDENIKTDTNTIYRIASISKSIIAASIMKLYEEDKFELDDDINDYLNGFEVRNPNYPNEKITFRMLLTHTSSIVDGDTYSTIYDIQDFGEYKPGSKFEYSNYGYNLLATLIEQISNQDFEDFVQNNIFKPLDMKASFNPNNIENTENIAILYGVDENGNWYERLNDQKRIKENYIMDKIVKDESGKILLGNAFKYSPAGGLRTSPNELAKFMIMLSNRGSYNGENVLKKDTVDLMSQMHWYGDALNGLYNYKGLGLHITDNLIEGHRLIGHTGEAYGLLSNMFYEENSGFGYIMMLNGSDYEFGEDGFTEIEKEIAKIIEKNFKQNKVEIFNININDESNISSNHRNIVLKEKVEKMNDDYMLNAMNFADIFNIKIFKSDKDNVKFIYKNIELVVNVDSKGRVPLLETANKLNIKYNVIQNK